MKLFTVFLLLTLAGQVLAQTRGPRHQPPGQRPPRHYPPTHHPQSCKERVYLYAPNFRLEDLQWVCGESRNSPVPGYGNNLQYVSCLERLLSSGQRDGAILTSQCKLEIDVFRGSKCISSVYEYAPYFRMEDLQWVCGESHNTPVPGYGNNSVYVNCLVDLLYSGQSDGTILTKVCKKEADIQGSFCMSLVNSYAPEYRLEDLQWVCGESYNTPVPNYGQNRIYTSCLRRLLRSGQRDGSVLTRQCKLEVDISTRY